MSTKSLEKRYISYNTFVVAGTALFSPILYIFLINSGYSYTEAGIYLAVFWGVSAVTELPLGIITDIIGQKSATVLSCFIRAIGLLLILSNNFILLIISAILTGIAESLISGTLSSWLMNQVSDKKLLDLDRIFSKAAAFGSIFSLIIGFVSAQYLFQLNSSLPIIASSLFFIMLAILIIIDMPEIRKLQTRKGSKSNNIISEGKAILDKILFLIRNEKTIFFVMLFLVFPTILDIGPSNQWQVAFSNENNTFILGYLWILISIVGIVTNMLIPKLPKLKGPLKEITLYIILDIIVILLITMTKFNILFFLIHIALFTILSLKINVHIQRNIVKDDKIRSTIVSSFYTIESFITMLLLPINGFLTDEFGIFNTWNLFVLFTIVLLFINFFMIKVLSKIHKSKKFDTKGSP